MTTACSVIATLGSGSRRLPPAHHIRRPPRRRPRTRGGQRGTRRGESCRDGSIHTARWNTPKSPRQKTSACRFSEPLRNAPVGSLFTMAFPPRPIATHGNGLRLFGPLLPGVALATGCHSLRPLESTDAPQGAPDRPCHRRARKLVNTPARYRSHRRPLRLLRRLRSQRASKGTGGRPGPFRWRRPAFGIRKPHDRSTPQGANALLEPCALAFGG